MSAPGSVAVVGLGLIGGSLARDLAARGIRVLGYDVDPPTLAAAAAACIITGVPGPAFEGIEAADVAVLAVPVGAAPDLLGALAPRLRRPRLVMDVGSTKRTIVAAAERLGLGDRFVGAHPLAGDHRSGWSASRAGLFGGARVYLCPAAGVRAPVLDLARRLWTLAGARPEVVTAAAHDARLAWTSHLPQAASTALARALAAAGIGPEELGPGGRDATRLAGSSPALWADIALDNAAGVMRAVAELEARLRELRLALEAGDREAVAGIFAAGRNWARRSDG